MWRSKSIEMALLEVVFHRRVASGYRWSLNCKHLPLPYLAGYFNSVILHFQRDNFFNDQPMQAMYQWPQT